MKVLGIGVSFRRAIAGLMFVFVVGFFCCRCSSCTHCSSVPSGGGETRGVEGGAEARLERDVLYLSVNCHPRSNDFPRNQQKARDYLVSQLKKSVHDVSFQAFEVEGRTYWNVRAIVPGKSAEKIVIGAHYDSCGMTPGADDNASGVAGVLELARRLGGAKPHYTIEFVLYANEEPPWFATEHMGSSRHVRLLKEEGNAIRAMICLEMIGYYSNKKGSQSYPIPLMESIYPDQGDFIAIVGNMSSVSLAKDVQKGVSSHISTIRLNLPNAGGLGLDLSDHRNFWKAGMTAVMVTDTAMLRNWNYHESGDTPDSLNYAKMKQVVDGVHRSVLSLAGIVDN